MIPRHISGAQHRLGAPEGWDGNTGGVRRNKWM